MADLKGINPSFCMHRIIMDEGAKPSREAQRRLNPHMKEGGEEGGSQMVGRWDHLSHLR